MVGKGRPCTLNSPCCYPSLVHLEGREEEVSYRSQHYDLSDQTWIFVDSEGFPPSSEQTPDTSVTQLKYVSWHERLILPLGCVGSFPPEEAEQSRQIVKHGKTSWLLTLHGVYFTPVPLCGWQ